ncbi:BspA family leucine-rich repeat surface protein [Niabella aquatica]
MLQKTMLAIAMVFLSFTGVKAQGFVTVWKSTTWLDQVWLPVIGTNLTITWTVEGTALGGSMFVAESHSYEVVDLGEVGTSRNVVVTVTGNLKRFKADEVGSSKSSELREIRQWGGIRWNSMESAFRGCSNLQLTATDAPDLSEVSSMAYMFQNCPVFTGLSSMTGWNTENVTNMNYLFGGCPVFNADISGWNTGNVASMSGMFENAAAFDADISGWETGNAVYISGMFKNAKAFNRNIGGWNTEKARWMTDMFSGATAFNQNLGKWNLSSVWDMTGMLSNSGMDCENYDRTLHGWATGGTAQDYVLLGADGRIYSASYGVAARSTLISTYGWTITGDSPDPNCNTTPLPVVFGSLEAYVKNGLLHINWFTQSETNNSHFIIEGSSDGKTFTKIATVASKAPGGNSSAEIQYAFEMKLPEALGLMGMALLGLMLTGMHRGKYLYHLALVAVLGFCAIASCNKNEISVQTDKPDKAFVRIVQVDIDATKTYSKIVKVIKR